MSHRRGLTLIEMLVVVAVVAILAGSLISKFQDTATEARSSALKHNLRSLRAQLELYQSQHNGKYPSATFVELLTSTNVDGTLSSGSGFRLGPYLVDIPVNPFTNSDTITAVSLSPATAAQVTPGGGWLYNATTGEVWADHAAFVSE